MSVGVIVGRGHLTVEARRLGHLRIHWHDRCRTTRRSNVSSYVALVVRRSASNRRGNRSGQPTPAGASVAVTTTDCPAAYGGDGVDGVGDLVGPGQRQRRPRHHPARTHGLRQPRRHRRHLVTTSFPSTCTVNVAVAGSTWCPSRRHLHPPEPVDHGGRDGHLDIGGPVVWPWRIEDVVDLRSWSAAVTSGAVTAPLAHVAWVTVGIHRHHRDARHVVERQPYVAWSATARSQPGGNVAGHPTPAGRNVADHRHRLPRRVGPSGSTVYVMPSVFGQRQRRPRHHPTHAHRLRQCRRHRRHLVTRRLRQRHRQRGRRVVHPLPRIRDRSPAEPVLNRRRHRHLDIRRPVTEIRRLDHVDDPGRRRQPDRRRRHLTVGARRLDHRRIRRHHRQCTTPDQT